MLEIHTTEKEEVDEVTTEEVRKIIKYLSTKKAPGIDGITNMALKVFKWQRI